MNTLLIHKKGDNVFWHTHNNLSNTSFAISDFDISIDGNKFKIIERNGAIRYEYNVTNIQVKNLNNPNESFVSGEQLYNRLLQLNYTPFLGNSGSGGSQDLQQTLENGATFTANGKTLTIYSDVISIFDNNTLSTLEIGMGDGPENNIFIVHTPNAGGQTELLFPKTESTENVAYQSYVNGIADNKADLVGGLVPSTQLPSYVDDVLEYANLASFPATGESGKVYIALDTNKTYRWTGSIYASLDEGLVLGETSSTAYRGDRGKTAYDHSQVSGNPHGTTAAQVGAYSTSQVDDLIANIQRNIIEDVTDRSHTGSLSETIVSNQLISANTLKTDTILELNSRITRSGANANATIKYYISPNNNSLTGATQICTSTITSTQILPKFTRQFSINSSSVLRGMNGTQNAASDEIASTLTILNLSLTLSSDYYLITTITLNSPSDTITQECIYLKSSR